MSAKQEIADTVARIHAHPGWTVSTTGRNHWRITNPEGVAITASMTPRGNRVISDFRADLRRLGWNDEEAKALSDKRAADALEADRAANDRKMEAAVNRAAQTTTTPTTNTGANPAPDTKGLIFIPPTPTIITPTNTDDDVTESAVDFTIYRQELIYVTQDMACRIAERNQCRQRHLYERHAAKLAGTMKRGAWRFNPADSLVFDEHGCLINGQHRIWAVVQNNWADLVKHYPNGVPFMATYDFPSEEAHIFDTGKARNASDALTVNKQLGWGTVESAALRMVLNYDASFTADGIPLWSNWRYKDWTNDEITAGGHNHADILTHSGLASRLYSKAKITRTAGMAIGYLLERDNPGGGPKGSNQDFFDGVCGAVAMDPRDPRIVLQRFAMRGGAKNTAKQVGLVHLDALIRHYAFYMLGEGRDLPAVNPSKPMWPIWREGMKVIANDLRYDKRDPRGNGNTGLY